jgi:hypothetical protein
MKSIVFWDVIECNLVEFTDATFQLDVCLFAFLAKYSTLKMEAVCYSVTSVNS